MCSHRAGHPSIVQAQYRQQPTVEYKSRKGGEKGRGYFFLSGAGKMSQFDYSEVHYVNYASVAASQSKTSISFITYEPIY
jgi:hypothetical protein